MSTHPLAEDFVRIWRLVQHVTPPAAHGDITLQRFWLLRQLRRAGPSRIGDLAAALGISQSATSVACQRLERAGLVTRTRDSQDERVVEVALTAAGARRVDEWRERRRAELAKLLVVLSEDEQQVLHALLERVLDQAGEAAL